MCALSAAILLICNQFGFIILLYHSCTISINCSQLSLLLASVSAIYAWVLIHLQLNAELLCTGLSIGTWGQTGLIAGS